MAKFVDSNALLYVWQKIKTLVSDSIADKVDKVSGKGLSTNDFTDTLKTKLDGITASADAVSFSRNLTSGTKVGTLTINGTGTDLYAPTNTDTHYASGTVVTSTASGTSNTTSALTNGNVYLNHIENGNLKNTHKITGSGATIVTSDESGNITIKSTNTTYQEASTTSAGLLSADDKVKLDGITTSADSVKFAQSLTSGTAVGTITINGTATTLYAPTNTDTHHTAKNVVGATTATSNTSTALTNGNVYLNLVENGSVRSTHKISGSGATTVTTDASGNIVISSTDTNTNTTYSAGTGISLSGTTFSNSGVRSIGSGSTNGTISVNTNGTSAEVAVAGLGSMAYASTSTYATASALSTFQSTVESTYAKKSDITTVFRYKGSVSTVSDLPSASSNTTGDTYNVTERGINYTWSGSAWDALGELFEVEAITNTEIDTLLA